MKSRLRIPINLFIRKSQTIKKKKIGKYTKSKKVKNRMTRMVGGSQKKNIWRGFSDIIIPEKLFKGGKKTKKKFKRLLIKPFGKKKVMKIINYKNK